MGAVSYERGTPVPDTGEARARGRHAAQGRGRGIASERRHNMLKGIKDFLTESQGPNLALTVLHMPYSLDGGGCLRSEEGSYLMLMDFGIIQLEACE